jgi:HK97 family phage major capsid protein
MAVTAVTKTSDFSGFLPAHVAAPFFEHASKVSAVQQLAKQVPLSYNGESVPVVTGRAVAGWVTEGSTKPASTGTLGLKTMTPHKLAVLVPVSQEVVRANPGGFMSLITDQVGEAFALAFDAAALHGTSTPFTTYLDQTTKIQELGANTFANGGIWADMVSVLDLLVTDGKKLTGFALDDVMEPNLLGSLDSNGRPLFVDMPLSDTSAASQGSVSGAARQGRLMGRPTWMADTVATTNKTTVVGYAGDWSQAAWGTVGGISWAISTEAAVTINGVLTSAFENNLVIVRAEAEYGWLVNDVAAFVKLSNLIGS